MSEAVTNEATKLTPGQREWLKTLAGHTVKQKELKTAQSEKALQKLVELGFAKWLPRVKEWRPTPAGRKRGLVLAQQVKLR